MGQNIIQTTTEGTEDDVEVSHTQLYKETVPAEMKLTALSLRRYILDNQETIATVACLDSGKTMVDASLGEILVTVEKLKWTIQHGEKLLRPERRPTNFLMMYKYNEVRWEPLGVIAACVSWKYVLRLGGNNVRIVSDR